MHRSQNILTKNTDTLNNNEANGEEAVDSISKSTSIHKAKGSRNGLTLPLESGGYSVVEAMSNLLGWSPTHKSRAGDGGSSISSEESANASDKNSDSPRKRFSKVKSAPMLDHMDNQHEKSVNIRKPSDPDNQKVKDTHYTQSLNIEKVEQQSFLYKNDDNNAGIHLEVAYDKKASSVTFSQDADITSISQSEKRGSFEDQKSGPSHEKRSFSTTPVVKTPVDNKASDSGSSKSSSEYRNVRMRERSFEKSLENILDKCSEKSADLSLSVESKNGGHSDISKSFDDSSLAGSSKKSDKKKRSQPWYTVLSPTYKSRSEDFKKQFKEVPPEERLIVDYSCALQKEILVQGRMYITQNWICFYANIFRWETVLTIPCKEVTAITKEKTARVIPNAIQICTDKEKYFFTSLGNRDKTYMMLFRMWQKALLQQPMNPQELWQWVHYNYGDDLYLTSDDEDYVAPDEDVKDVAKKDNEDSELAIQEEEMEEEEGGVVTLCKEADMLEPLGSTRSATAELPTDQSDTTEDEEEVVIPPEHKHFNRCYHDETLTMPVERVYELMFTKSDFYMRLFERAARKDLQYGEWRDDPGSGKKIRNISYVIPLNYSIGPKSAKTEEKQILYSGTKEGSVYLIDAEVICNGIPYGDTFMVVNRYTLSRISPLKSRIQISTEMRYKKSVWGVVKSMIEKNTFQGCLDFFNMLTTHLHQEALKYEKTENQQQHLKRKVRKKRSRGAHTPQETMRQKLVSRHLSLMEKPKRQQTKANVSPPSPTRNVNVHREETLNKLNAETLVRVILVVLVLLVLFNAVLFYKLWYLESYTNFLYFPRRGSYIEDIQSYPKTQEEWVQLLRQQQHLHENEIDKWNEVLGSSITLIDEMKETLVKLKSTLEHKLQGTTHAYTAEYNKGTS